MATDPLFTVLKLAQDAEEQAALKLKAAQLECQRRQSQLQSLNSYRLDYMQQLSAQQGKQIRADYYQQFHRFIRQVDDAIRQQAAVVQDADKQRQYRQQYWMETQQKRKAVELLLEKKAAARAVKQAKQEQKMTDEFAAQQFYRQRLNSSS
ncbi:flagellar export protein FliJ [Shewanella sp. A3A]|uniref:Flagellar FliJ protein n=1 Tax=Shewanella electrica TaxID=515560 RepID=A0ABT2FJG4_9GAMM|nr:flagellar export protein FliJ [Shewanella electrica]MCH1920580.1 flagellar export protein FliJ [Shewanella ferrihydritica]MCH1924574.1 flagellar export protein FliJ [Shewanella electrica]MCS4556475.1 flagellar export protein FliJ [Shewanella electrica]